MKYVFILLSGLVATTASAGGSASFIEGQRQFTVVGGTGHAYDETYFVLGAGINYYVVDGLSIGLQLETSIGADPGVFKATASTQYVFYDAYSLLPYIGAFYRYTDFDGESSLHSVGGRSGLYTSVGRNGYAGFGLVIESYFDCDSRVYGSCTQTYPEISFVITF